MQLDCSTCKNKINTHPHGLGIGSDGKTVWYTGKATGTLGRIKLEGNVETFALFTVGSPPIYINAGSDGNSIQYSRLTYPSPYAGLIKALAQPSPRANAAKPQQLD